MSPPIPLGDASPEAADAQTTRRMTLAPRNSRWCWRCVQGPNLLVHPGGNRRCHDVIRRALAKAAIQRLPSGRRNGRSRSRILECPRLSFINRNRAFRMCGRPVRRFSDVPQSLRMPVLRLRLVDAWSCQVDDDCPACGLRHISPEAASSLTMPVTLNRPRRLSGPALPRTTGPARRGKNSTVEASPSPPVRAARCSCGDTPRRRGIPRRGVSRKAAATEMAAFEIAA